MGKWLSRRTVKNGQLFWRTWQCPNRGSGDTHISAGGIFAGSMVKTTIVSITAEITRKGCRGVLHRRVRNTLELLCWRNNSASGVSVVSSVTNVVKRGCYLGAQLKTAKYFGAQLKTAKYFGAQIKRPHTWHTGKPTKYFGAQAYGLILCYTVKRPNTLAHRQNGQLLWRTGKTANTLALMYNG